MRFLSSVTLSMSLSLLLSESDDDGIRRDLAAEAAVGLVTVRCRASSLDDVDDSESDDVKTVRADLLVADVDARGADSVEHLRLGSVDRDVSSSLDS